MTRGNEQKELTKGNRLRVVVSWAAFGAWPNAAFPTGEPVAEVHTPIGLGLH